MRATTIRRMMLWFIAGVVAIGAVTGCSSDQTYLPALQADPMASWQPEGAELVNESEQEYDEGGSTSKQSLAAVTRVFRLPSAADVDAARQQALAYAESEAGWSADELGRDGFLQRTGPAGSSMTLSVLSSVTSDSELVVKLSAP